MQRPVLIMFVAMSLIASGGAAGKLMTSSLGLAPVFVAWSPFVVGVHLLPDGADDHAPAARIALED